MLGQFLGIGKSCRKSLESLEADNSPTIGALLHTHNRLLTFLTRGATATTALDKRISHFCKLSADNCALKFNTEVDRAAQISAILDPRYRQLNFLAGADAGKCRDVLTAAFRILELETKGDSPIQPSALKKRKRGRDDEENAEFNFNIDDDSPSKGAITNEVQRYTALPNEPKDTDILSWWRSHSQTFPLLSQLARRYLAIPASSASSERLFSRMKLVATDARQNLKPDTLCMLLFIEAHHNDNEHWQQ